MMYFQIPENYPEAAVFCRDWLNGKKEFIFHTSGSTGLPKPITIQRKQMIASAHMTAKALKLEKGDKAFLCLNPAFIGGVMMMVRAMEIDMELIAVPPTAKPLQNINNDFCFDFSAFAPIQLYEMLKHSTETSSIILNKAKALLIGGAPVNKELKNLCRKHLTTKVYSTFGMTETVSHIALQNLHDNLDNNLYTILDDVQISSDSRGCLVVAAPCTLYQPIVTNDLVEIVDNRNFIYLGRIDNVINSGGIKINGEQLENEIGDILASYGKCFQFFVSSLPDQKLGEKCILIIESKDNIEEEITSILSQNLNRYTVPKHIYCIPSFAMTPTGKINRKKTKQLIVNL
ncbi:MAG: AMP-binding protein [Cytophagaceae bacterium]